MFEAVSPDVLVEALDEPGTVSDDFLPGYSTFTYVRKGKVVGYAGSKGKKAGGIIFGKQVRLISNARPLDHAKPEGLEPTLAEFGIIHYQSRAYMCVSSNFGGLGRSGSFQNVRLGYISLLAGKEGAALVGPLYFSVRDIRTFKK